MTGELSDEKMSYNEIIEVINKIDKGGITTSEIVDLLISKLNADEKIPFFWYVSNQPNQRKIDTLNKSFLVFYSTLPYIEFWRLIKYTFNENLGITILLLLVFSLLIVVVSFF